jgi:hypothetical protein
LPASLPAAAVTQFERCFVTQSRSPDPSVTPAGCRVPTGTPQSLARAFADAADHGRRVDFLYSFERTLLYEVGVFLLAALLIGFLPKIDPAAMEHAPPTPE